MGFNISGIVINKNLKTETEELSKILNFDIEFDKEIDFETASENWKDEGIVDIYFGERGTLIFVNEDLCLNEGYPYPATNVFTFAMSETSMAFIFSYNENQNNIRYKMEVNGEIIDESGIKLKKEDENNDISEVILNQLSEVLGKSFRNIEAGEKAYRFIIKNPSNNVENNQQSFDTPIKEVDKFDFLSILNREDLKNKYSKAELLQLFNKMVAYAQQNSINFFFHPSYYNGSSNIFMVNLLYLKDTISEHSDLLELLNTKIPMNAFGAIGKAYENQIDKEANIQMLQMINVMKPIQENGSREKLVTNNNKKWWQFWK